MKIIALFIICSFLAFKLAESVSCYYGFDKFSTFSYDISGYACKVWDNSDSTSQISGIHTSSRSDRDVTIIQKYSELEIVDFPSSFCQKFGNLGGIDLSDAGIETVGANSLESCKQLRHLSFSSNKIGELSEKLLSNNFKVTHLSFANNELKTLPDNLFLNQRALETLDLSNNYLKTLPANIFKSLSNLKSLWLLNNKLKSLRPNLFSSLQNLNSLSLSYNKIPELPRDVFGPLRNLEKLWISSNQLEQIHSNSFGNNDKLSLIDLSDNKIAAIDERIVDKLKSITSFDMRENACTQAFIDDRSKMREKLRVCFDLYQPSNEPERPLANVNIPQSCGKPVIGRQNIIGGTHLGPGIIRWNAALLNTTGGFFCSGTLVTSTRIVTAAHCIHQKGHTRQLVPREIIVLLGAYDLNVAAEPGRSYPVIRNIFIHNDWNPNLQSFDADIAILELSSEIQFNDYIQPACLIDPDSEVAMMTEAYVTGYGKSEDKTKQHENTPKVLVSPIHDNEDCFLNHKELTDLSSKRTFCAGQANGEGVCVGDSGGGLFIIHDNTFFLRGIVSSSKFQYGEVCDTNTYAVYTNVLKFNDWILTVE